VINLDLKVDPLVRTVKGNPLPSYSWWRPAYFKGNI